MAKTTRICCSVIGTALLCLTCSIADVQGGSFVSPGMTRPGGGQPCHGIRPAIRPKLPIPSTVSSPDVIGRHRRCLPWSLRSTTSDKESAVAEDAPNAANSEGAEDDDEEEEDEEWEFVEYEALEETDFYNSEWKVGTVMNSNPEKIVETWVRLLPEGTKAIWGDGKEGRWSIDVPSQFFSVSKETWGGWGGKQIWAGVVDDYYYLQGTVRGWSPIRSASVTGQWQAKRLGVTKEEAGEAPWFQDDEEEADVEEDKEGQNGETETS